MINKYYHIFLLDKEKGKEDAKLRLRIRWGKNIVAFNVGFRVDINKWSLETQRCKNNTTHGKKKIQASVINREINLYETTVENIFNKFNNERKIPDKEEFKALFIKEIRGIDIDIEKPSDKNIWKYIDDFTKEIGMKNNWTQATYQKFKTLKNHLISFNNQLSFEKLNESGLNNFMIFLRNDANLRNSSIKKQISFLKWFMRWATSKGYNSIRDFESFAPKLKDTEKKVIFLEWEELMKIYNFSFPKNKKYLERVRDVFCFCCFTSLRYSDVENLKRHNIINDTIYITTIKTADTISIELNDYSREILNKYKDDLYPDNKALPVITNQKMNQYLKEVGYICGIDTPVTITYYKGNKRIDETFKKYELLGTHCGRRTFICNALMMGIQPEVVMKWTGHSDYKSMKPYIDIADSAKHEAMKLFNKQQQGPQNSALKTKATDNQ